MSLGKFKPGESNHSSRKTQPILRKKIIQSSKNFSNKKILPILAKAGGLLFVFD
jgi:hypothetical protein